MYTCITSKMRIRTPERTGYWCWTAGIKGTTLKSPVVDETGRGWLKSVLFIKHNLRLVSYYDKNYYFNTTRHFYLDVSVCTTTTDLHQKKLVQFFFWFLSQQRRDVARNRSYMWLRMYLPSSRMTILQLGRGQLHAESHV